VILTKIFYVPFIFIITTTITTLGEGGGAKNIKSFCFDMEIYIFYALVYIRYIIGSNNVNIKEVLSLIYLSFTVFFNQLTFNKFI